jgi:hypothetical protein
LRNAAQSLRTAARLTICRKHYRPVDSLFESGNSCGIEVPPYSTWMLKVDIQRTSPEFWLLVAKFLGNAPFTTASALDGPLVMRVQLGRVSAHSERSLCAAEPKNQGNSGSVVISG